GGLLPSKDEWDKAAGFHDGDLGAVPDGWDPDKRGEGDIAVGREEPLPAGAAAKDRGRFSGRDMAGNGREGARTISSDMVLPRTVPLDNPSDEDSVELRGQSYLRDEPLTKDNLSTKPLEYFKWRDDVSFRVVRKLPSP